MSLRTLGGVEYFQQGDLHYWGIVHRCCCHLSGAHPGFSFLGVLPKIAVTAAQRIHAQIAAGNKEPMNGICRENSLRTTTKLKKEMYKYLSTEGRFCGKYIGFADCAVDRTCPKPIFADLLIAL